MKPKKCKICKELFRPIRFAQSVCGYLCSIKHANIARERQNKKDVSEYQKEKKVRQQALKTKSDWLNECQVIFNKYIRLRDLKSGYGCISCGTKKSVQYCAGHYRTTKAAPHLRFDERNVHLQCNRYCNQALSGNIINYRPNLIERYGVEFVEGIESDNKAKNYTIDDIKDIKLFYKAKIKEI